MRDEPVSVTTLEPIFRIADHGDVEKINAILNHPAVRPHVFIGDDLLDFSHNIGVTPTYLTRSGVMFAEAIGTGEYLVTSGFIPDGHGLHAAMAHRAALDHFFSTTDATRVTSVFEEGNEPAIRNLQSLGFRFRGGFGGRCAAEMDWIDWALTSRGALREGRKWAKTHSTPWVSNMNLHMLGAFLLTSKGGWPGKALSQFNKWAKLEIENPLEIMDEEGTRFRYCGVIFHIEDKTLSVDDAAPTVGSEVFGLMSREPMAMMKIPGETLREKILWAQDKLSDLPQADLPLSHYFAPGIYMREMFIPKGCLVIGKIHAHQHPVMLVKGTACYLTEFDGINTITGLMTMVSLPGTKRMLYTLTDTVWMTVHHNPDDLRDPESLESLIIVPNYERFDALALGDAVKGVV